MVRVLLQFMGPTSFAKLPTKCQAEAGAGMDTPLHHLPVLTGRGLGCGGGSAAGRSLRHPTACHLPAQLAHFPREPAPGPGPPVHGASPRRFVLCSLAWPGCRRK